MQPTAHIPSPDLAFRDGTPVSGQFDDVYFSRAGGIAETEYVFLKGNGLPARFADSTTQPSEPTGSPRSGGVSEAKGQRAPSIINPFTIGELGFGTGLNFLVAWREWLRTSGPDAQLHYISFEKYPLTPDMLRAALALQPELKELAAQLIAAYPLRLPGLHRIHLPRVTLTLGFGDAAGLLPQIDTSVDAWFLDGFAPAKNPDMWDETILAAIGSLSAPDATFATFTAAGFVRRGLAAQGFTVEKIAGFGHKRDMLVGHRIHTTDEVQPSEATAEPRSGGGLGVMPPSGAKRSKSLLLLGAGIAGATAARALAERGYHVTVLERGEIASGASGNDAAVLFPQLSKKWTPAAAWYFAAYSYMLHQLPRWSQAGLDIVYTQCGMLRLPRHADEETQLRNLNATLGLDPAIVQWIDRAEASAVAGLDLTTGAAYFTQGTWLKPASLCAALLQHERITLHTHTAVTALSREGENWRATTDSGDLFEASHCLLATAQDTAALAPQYGLKLNQVAGQVSLFNTRDTAAALRSILCRTGYIIPAGEHILVGATYNHPATDPDFRAVTDANHAHNRKEVEDLLPDWLRGDAVAGRTGIRATTPDRLPYIGQLDDGLWITAGHGSRGMLSAPLAAEVIASMINAEAMPATAELCRAVHPHRLKNKTA